MNNFRAIVVVFVSAAVITAAYGTYSLANESHSDSLSLSNVYLSYAGAEPNSTFAYSVFNGTPAKLQVDVYFNSNISSNLSYIYVTTPGFNVQNWTYQYGTYILHSGKENSTFIGSVANNAVLQDLSHTPVPSKLVINISSAVHRYNGSISIHVVFAGMPVGVVY